MTGMLVRLLLVVLVSIVVTGCAQKTETAGDPKSVIYENLKAMENEDLGIAMATIDEESETYAQTKELARRLFEMYDLRYELDSVRVLGQTDSEAKLECIQTTRKVSGPAFRDNKIIIEHRLRVAEGRWRIYASTVKKIDYLN